MKILNSYTDDTNKVIARLNSITRYISTKNGRNTPIIIIHTDRGNYSAFENIWNNQNIPAEDLTEGDLLEIDYTIYTAANGVQYKNFVTVNKAQGDI